MANASRKHMGVGAQGKGDGSGATTEVDKDVLPDNMVLSNRDKARHPEERGQDGKHIQSEQFQDHDSDRLSDD
ncbi:hypothetical protein PQJ75_14145 [Rhodoplanes sp. TEM]|uniref:Uncharacterized protein n=1 Tax=Rhodoplanes tepidamans TaxID=200616 RepID=A0ABT5JKJ0_RHOTP|nr:MULTISPECIES: hypothetical protein [Rhodoplanes]MDC7789861.1 hypothetical protein [Rhodoplanes tepidamans]MDC7984874.1 hypothetical protein [Rhodoplanes sp. TEM]MDQ0358463.1 hypothetical protein [Rhodoplanes tepidamans]